MQALEEGAVGIALMLNSSSKLEGVLTDGDIRRALLNGATLDKCVAPYVNRHFTSVRPDEDRAHVLDLMQARYISQIPIVESDGKLAGLHLLREIIGSAPRPNWAVIMAGGLGTRLRPITESIPKPMIRVAGRPILERLILHLVGYGIQRIFLSVNYLAHIIEEHFGKGERFGCQIQYLREKEQMGSGGALSLLPEVPREPLIILNGDLVTQLDFSRFLEFHQRGGYLATLAVRRYFHTVPFGCVEVHGERIHSLAEKPIIEELINAGAYIVAPALLERIPKQFYPITDLFGSCLERNEPVGAWEIDGDWLDVGQREQLRQAQEGIT